MSAIYFLQNLIKKYYCLENKNQLFFFNLYLGMVYNNNTVYVVVVAVML